ncbi:enolase-phosphatase E1 [Ciborinia camelliae]|nr:enolase-phosphatase E1 [Ciborinia camelliae]
MENLEGKTRVKVVLLDIEGTVCPISFVKDVLFPYALSALPETLATQWDTPSFLPYRSAFPPEHSSTPDALHSHVRDLMAQDLKIPYLKSLQGYLWLRGYESGELKCPLFPDVYPAMKKWKENGAKICIYSSGSVAAQKLLWRYTTEGDLRGLIWNGVGADDGEELEGGYWDTVNAGLKQDRASYEKIAKANRALGEVDEWLFLSDNIKEVRAAREAGMKSFVVVREGNAVVSAEESEGQVLVESFGKVEVAGETV